MKVKNLILGGGATGLILGKLLPDSKIIDKNPMGQLNTPFIPGPRIFKYNYNVFDFLAKHTSISNIENDVINIGYIDENNNEIDLTHDYKVKYSIIARNTSIVEPSFLSSGENSIEIFSNKEFNENFYNEVFKNIYSQLRESIVEDTIISIDTKKKIVETSSKQIISYQNCYSTINLKILLKLLNIKEETFSLETSNKHFIQCKYSNIKDIELSKKFHYVYSINGLYTRKTYFKDYIVYELTNAAAKLYNELKNENLKKNFLMSVCDSNFVIRKIFDLPFQIEQSIDIRNIQGINLVGRYSQWNHSIKANEVINEFKDLI